MKYSQLIGVLASIALIAVCFLPWVHIPSLNIQLSGLNGKASAELNFGSQIKSHGFFIIIMICCFLVQQVWAKRTNVFVGAINFAWAFKNFLIFSMCRGGECPEKMPGLYALVAISFVMMMMAFFPRMRVKN